jgi:hypothetical protein
VAALRKWRLLNIGPALCKLPVLRCYLFMWAVHHRKFEDHEICGRTVEVAGQLRGERGLVGGSNADPSFVDLWRGRQLPLFSHLPLIRSQGYLELKMDCGVNVSESKVYCRDGSGGPKGQAFDPPGVAGSHLLRG